MRRLAATVLVHRPAGSVMLPAGSVPGPDDAALITNPACWDADDDTGPETGPGGEGDAVVPDESWTITGIQAWAADHGVDLAGARKKEDLLMIVRDETSSREDDDGVDNP